MLGLILLIAQPLEVKTPASGLKAASADVARIPPDAAKYTRYLWLGNLDAKEKQELWQVLSVWCNILSREPDLVRPVVLVGGVPVDGLAMNGASWQGADLIRVNLEDYGWKTTTWEKLAEQEPYFTVKLETNDVIDNQVYWPGGIWTREDGGDGKHYPAGYYPSVKMKAAASKVVKKVFGLAPWVGDEPGVVSALTVRTGSQTPIVSADWFLWQVGIQADRAVGFYGFLETKNRADFQRLVGFDQKLSQEFTRELLASVSNSGVSRQPRRIARFEKLGGGYWATFDNREALDNRNPLRVLNGGFLHDAEEVFAHGSNGLWKVGLFAADGTRQDSAPDFVGFDRTAHSNDGRIHIGVSCFRCHQQDKESDGLNAIKDWSRNLFSPPLALTSPDYAKLKKLRQSYLRRLEPFMAGDRVRHAEAVKECCGLSTLEFGNALARVWARYDSPVNLSRAALELGVTPDRWRMAVDAYMKRSGQTDTVLGMFARPLKEQEPIPLETWHESYPQGQTILRAIR